MKTIWKFTLKPQCELLMPKGAEVLSAREQYGAVCLWVLVDPDATAQEARHFRVRGTGHSIEGDPGRFIDTVTLQGGALVWHVFEVRP